MRTKTGTWIVDHRVGLQQMMLLIGCGLLAWAFSPHGALAQTVDPSGFVTSALDMVKKLWGLVFVACIIGLIYYLVAYFTQGLIPALWQPVSGNWGRNAILIAVGANIAMGVLVGLAEASKGGWSGGT